MKNRVVILGCGYVGLAIVKNLLAQGLEVYALTRNEARIEELKKMGVFTVSSRIDSTEWHNELDPNIENVIDCVSAAESSVDGYRQSYYNGLKSILEWRTHSDKSSKGQSFIYTSSTSVYPQLDGSWVHEGSDVYHGDFERTNILLESEQLAVSLSSFFERCVVLRLAGIYGPQRHSLIQQLKHGQIEFPGDGNSWLNLIHRQDIASAVEGILKSDCSVHGIYNLTDNEKYTKKQIIEWTAEKLGIGSVSFSGKASSARRSFLPNGQMPNRRISNEKFKKQFHWKPNYNSFMDGYLEILKQ